MQHCWSSASRVSLPDGPAIGPRAGLMDALAAAGIQLALAWLERGGAEGDLMELNGWISPQMLTWYGASARRARARRSYDRIMNDTPDAGVIRAATLHCP